MWVRGRAGHYEDVCKRGVAEGAVKGMTHQCDCYQKREWVGALREGDEDIVEAHSYSRPIGTKRGRQLVTGAHCQALAATAYYSWEGWSWCESAPGHLNPTQPLQPAGRPWPPQHNTTNYGRPSHCSSLQQTQQTPSLPPVP